MSTQYKYKHDINIIKIKEKKIIYSTIRSAFSFSAPFLFSVFYCHFLTLFLVFSFPRIPFFTIRKSFPSPSSNSNFPFFISAVEPCYCLSIFVLIYYISSLVCYTQLLVLVVWFCQSFFLSFTSMLFHISCMLQLVLSPYFFLLHEVSCFGFFSNISTIFYYCYFLLVLCWRGLSLVLAPISQTFLESVLLAGVRFIFRSPLHIELHF